MKHAGTAVISEAAPGSEHGAFWSCGEGADVGKFLQEQTIVLENGSDPRLLQHDFGNPDAVRVASCAPWKITAMVAVPGEQGAAKILQVVASECGVGRH